MKTSRSLLRLFSLLACLAPIAHAAELSFGPEGLSSIQADGAEWLDNSRTGFWRGTTASGEKLSARPASTDFNPETRVRTETYDWGVLQLAYQPEASGLRLDVSVHNTGAEVIESLEGFILLTLKAPGEGRSWPQVAHGVEGPHLTIYEGETGSVVFSADTGDVPVGIALQRPKNTDVLQCRVGFGGGKVILDNITDTHSIPPGGRFDFTLRLRLGGPDADPLDLAEPELAAYRDTHPFLLDWPDRRPILRLFFGGGLPKAEAVANLREPEAVVPPESDPEFRKRLLDRIDNAIEAAKVTDAQAVILWDVEGGTFPHAITYIGDPRKTRLLNPQMDLALDEAVRRLHEAGVLAGFTLRASRLVLEGDNAAQRHAESEGPFEELNAKVAYARERWNCRVFYVDTNFFWRPYGPDKTWKSGRLPPELWAELKKKYPDTLFIPEFGSIGDYRSTVPYGEADMGDYGTPELVRRIWPDAFRVIVVEDADPAENYDRFVQTVREGNSLMTFGYSPKVRNVLFIARYREEARLLDAGVPDVVQGADAETRTRLLSSPELAVRFHAARGLSPDSPAASSALLARVTDESGAWVVRHAALRSLASNPPPELLPVALPLITDEGLGLYHAATDALAAMGEPAERAIMARIREAAATRTLPNVWDRTGNVLVRLEASGRATELQELCAALPPEDPNTVPLLRLIGNLGHPESEAFLTGYLDHPKWNRTAAAALVDLGADSARQVVVDARERAKADGDKPMVDFYNRILR